MVLRRILSGALCGMLMFTAFGCSEDPVGSSEKTPDPPRNLATADVSESSVDLQWTPPADSAGISGYRVWWKAAAAATSDSADVAAPATLRRMTGLTPGVNYTFSVASKRGSKISTPATVAWSSVVAPTSLTVSFSSFNTAAIQWTAPAGAGPGGYLLAWKGSNGDSSQVDLGAGTSSAELSGLMSSVSYTFYLRARLDARLSPAVTTRWTGVTLGAPAGLGAVSLGDSSVKLAWTAPADTGTIRYTIAWRAANGGDSASVSGITATSWVGKNLTPGTIYQFHVYADRGIARSQGAGIEWAPARRFTLEPTNSTTLAIYEQSSPYGNILAIDPEFGGPRRLNASSAPAPNSLQLALFVSGPNPSEFEIGPVYAFPSFDGAFGLDSNTFVSTNAFSVTGLDSWFVDGPLDKAISPAGNISSYMFPTTDDKGLGRGFVVRTGTAGSYHYARIFIANVSGELLQGTAPHRFINLEVSYQMTPNVPYARAGRRTSAPAVQARQAR